MVITTRDVVVGCCPPPPRRVLVMRVKPGGVVWRLVVVGCGCLVVTLVMVVMPPGGLDVVSLRVVRTVVTRVVMSGLRVVTGISGCRVLHVVGRLVVVGRRVMVVMLGRTVTVTRGVEVVLGGRTVTTVDTGGRRVVRVLRGGADEVRRRVVVVVGAGVNVQPRPVVYHGLQLVARQLPVWGGGRSGAWEAGQWQ